MELIHADENSEIAKGRKERIKKNAEEASKPVGDFLIKITDSCFEPCVNTSNISLSAEEKQCFDSCYLKMVSSYKYAFKKFHKTSNHSYVIERSEFYDDIGDIIDRYWITDPTLNKINKVISRDANIIMNPPKL